MKTLLTLIAIISILVCNSQVPKKHLLAQADGDLGKVQIEMPIKITVNGVPVKEGDTSVHVFSEAKEIGYTLHSANPDFTLMLQPNMEYTISFKKNGCITKKIFVSTKNVSAKYSYTIATIVDLKTGNTNVACGQVIFNTQSVGFTPTVNDIKVYSSKNKPVYY